MVREPKHQDQLQSMVFTFFKEYKIARLLKQSNITKQAGVSVLDVFRVIFSLVFAQRSLNRWLKQSGCGGFGGDTVYRFLNSPRHNWRRFLLLLGAAVIQRVSYLLFDSWFAYPVTILKALKHSMNVVCMIKAMPKVHYEHDGRRLTLKELYSTVRKRRGRAKILASVIVSIGRDEKNEPVLARIVFVRDRNRSCQWLALLSTDTNLSDDEVIKQFITHLLNTIKAKLVA